MEMLHRNPLRGVGLAGIFALLLMPFAANAGADSGLYLGLGVGQAKVEDSTSVAGIGDIDYSGDDTAYKLIVGYNIGFIPLVDLAVEGSYRDYGEITDKVGGVKVKYEQSSLDAFGLAGLSFGPFGVFAKAGFSRWDADRKVGGQSKSDSGTDPAYGIGVRLHLFSLTARLEYERFEQDNVDDVYMTSASVLYTF